MRPLFVPGLLVSVLVTSVLVTSVLFAAEPGASVFTAPIPGPKVLRLGDADLPAPAAGSDATAAIQALLDQAARTGSLATLPSGTYVVSDALRLWKDVRLIGVGPTKPILAVAANTPAYNGATQRPVIHFCSDFPKQGGEVKDANNDTFSSGLMNLAVRIAEGNPQAAAIRMRGAQLCVVQDCDVLLSADTIGFDLIANVVERTRIIGGDYAVVARRTPAWQAAMIDCTFSGQSVAAMNTDDVGMTLIRPQFIDVPIAVEVSPGKSDQIPSKNRGSSASARRW